MKSSTVQRLLDEHIPMPGFPQLIVTRGFAYEYLKARDWHNMRLLDITVFGAKRTNAPLTDTVLVGDCLAAWEEDDAVV